MKWMGLAVALAAVAGWAVLAQAKDKGGTTSSDVERDAKKAVDSTGRYLDERREEFQAEMKDRLEKLSEEIDALRDQAKSEGEKADRSLRTRLQELEQKRKELAAKLQETAKQSDATFKKVKKDLEKAVNDLSDSVKSLVSRPERNEHRM